MSDEHLIPAEPESTFDSHRRKAGLILTPSIFFLILLIDIPGISVEAHRLSAILAATIVLWITEPIPLPVTAILGPALAVGMGVAPAAQVFAPFADPLIFVFIGSFILAEAMFFHGVNERIAYGVMSNRWIGSRPIGILVAYGTIAAFVSMWISNTATAAMMLPIGLSLLAFMESQTRLPASYGPLFVLITAYGASYGGAGTPIGTPPNIITIGMIERYTGIHISFVQWMMIGVPVAAVMMILLFVYARSLGTGGVTAIPGVERVVRERKASLGSWKRGEKNVVIAFGVTVALWIGPGMLPLVLGSDHPMTRTILARIPESVAALCGVILLFVLPLSSTERSTIPWRQAAKIDWGTILLFGGGLALGQLAFQTQLAAAVGNGIIGFFPVTSVVSLSFGAAFFGVLISEVMSNTAAANIAIPVVISIAQAAGIDPVAPALSAGLAASMGVLLPVSTPPCAIVYASGRVSIPQMVRYGILLDVIAVILVPVLVLALVPLVFG